MLSNVETWKSDCHKKHLQLGNVRASQNIELITATVIAEKSKIHIVVHYRQPNKINELYFHTVKKDVPKMNKNDKLCVFIIGGA